MKLEAKVVPFSSVVGGGVVLTDDTGRVVAQLSLLNLADAPSDLGAYKAKYQTMCQRVADAINAGQPETKAKHLKTGGTYDVLGEALGQGGIFENEKAIVYRQPGGGKLFFRLPGEFFDGRFEETPEA